MRCYLRIKKVRTGFICQIGPGFLTSLVQSDGGVTPQFGSVPISYPRLQARFLRKELRRAGYHVSSVPVFWVSFVSRISAFRQLRAAKLEAKAKWKK